MSKGIERRVQVLEEREPPKVARCLLMVEGEPIPENWDYENGLVLCADDGISEGGAR